MVKKFLLSAAVVGALATSAMAFDVYPSNELSNYNPSDVNGTTTVIQKTNTSQGNALIFPAYFVGNGWSSTLRVINTSSNAVVAKVVLYAGKDSHEVRDFNIYLSGNDEFMAKIKVDENGKVVIESTDDSAPVEGTSTDPYPFATADNPLKKELDSNYGYIQVIGMMQITDSNNQPVSFHGKHSLEREVFDKLSKKERTGSENPNLVFNNGVILNNVATSPLVSLDQNYTASDNKLYKSGIVGNVLTGDIRITDEAHGKDMVMPAVALNYSNANPVASLVFLEGEKANLADACIDNTNNLYDVNTVEAALRAVSPNNNVFMTYGDAEINNNYVLLTSPFKRILVQQSLYNRDNNTGAQTALFTHYSYDATNNKINYGKVELLANIYDTNENFMSAGQFSPATTPTIVLKNEVDNTGYDASDTTKLPYYLQQAQAKGYEKGYVTLRNKVNGNVIPGIVTQMIATKAGSQTVTNWIVPAQN